MDIQVSGTVQSLVSVRSAQAVVSTRNREGFLWHYEHALGLMAVLTVGSVYEIADFSEFVSRWADGIIDPSGAISGYRNDEFNLDQVNAARTLLWAAGMPLARKYGQALDRIDYQLKNQPKTPSGGYWHKKIYPDQMWLDGLYMAEPYSAARISIEGGSFDHIAKQFRLMESGTRDPDSGLLYHAWDESGKQLWCAPGSEHSPNFWSRSMGWYAMALVDVLDFVPPDSACARELREILDRLFKALLRIRDAQSKLWYQVTDQGNRAGNYLESSGSAMFARSMMKAARKGYADASWMEEGKASFEALLELKTGTDPAGMLFLKDVCSVAGLGGNPYRDGSYEYYVGEPIAINDLKGLGPFTLAALEAEVSENAALADKLAAFEAAPPVGRGSATR